MADQHGFAGAAFRVLKSTELGWDHLSVNGGQAGPGIVKIMPIAAQKIPTDTGERRPTQCGQMMRPRATLALVATTQP